MKKTNLELGSLENLILSYSLRDRSFWLKVVDYLREDFFENNNIGKIFFSIIILNYNF